MFGIITLRYILLNLYYLYYYTVKYPYILLKGTISFFKYKINSSLSTLLHSFFTSVGNHTYVRVYYDKFIFFLKKYIYTINHKRIAMNYFLFSLWTAMSGTLLATIIRLELAYPGSHFFKGDSIKYLQVITAHGLIMVFFVVVPIIFGFLANFFIPYHIGSKDVAFPRLNSLGFWIQPAGYFLISKSAFFRPQITKSYDNSLNYFYSLDSDNIDSYYSLFYLSKHDSNINTHNITSGGLVNRVLNIPNSSLVYKSNKGSTQYRDFILNNSIGSNNTWSHFFNDNVGLESKTTFYVKCSSASYTMSGWTYITPFSAKTDFTGFGAQDLSILAILFSGLSTTLSFTNLLITRRTLGMPGLKYRKILVPFFSITLFLVMRMLALIVPVLGAAMIMLECDRHFKTSFFDYAYGGDVILFQHLFWFFGHPEVYVVIIPAFGIVNMLIPFYNFRRIASKGHLIWATYVMAYMGFLVWGHHMYLVGLDHRSRSLYSTVTIMISLPAVVKLINWTLTFLNSSILINVPIVFVLSFFLFFLCGGLTGMWLSHVGLNIYVHDTFYVVAHFHFMFSCATFSAIFASIYHYYYTIFGVKYSIFFAYCHCFYWFVGQWLTFLPLFWVGYNGLPRRYHDYPIMFAGWHGLATAGHILTLISILMFFIVLIDSRFSRVLLPVNSPVGIVRFYKRICFYLFKIDRKDRNKTRQMVYKYIL